MVSIEEYEELIRLENNQVYLSDSRFYMNFSYKRISEIELSEYNSKSLCSYAGTKLIKSYAGISFRHPNDCLRKNMKDEFVQLYELLLNKSLDELPAHNDQIVWRWNIGSIPPEGIKFLKRYVGKNIMVPQFWSTTKTLKTEKPNLFKIQTSENSNARDISDISDKPEDEVLFKNNTIFNIESFKNNIFTLSEIENTKDVLVLCNYFWI